MKKIKYHIEFFGMPGAGKSALYEKLFDFDFLEKCFLKFDDAIDLSIKNNILNQERRNWKIWIKYIMNMIGNKWLWPVYKHSNNRVKAYFRFIAQQKDFNYKLQKIMLDRKLNQNEIEKLNYWFFQLISGYQLVQENFLEKECLIIDEGFVHRSVALWVRGIENNPPNHLNTYFEMIPLPNVVLFVDIDPNKAIQRMQNRGNNNNLITPLEKLKEEERYKKIQYVNLIINKSLEILSDKEVEIIKINNDNTLEQSTQQLYKLFHNWCNRCG